MTELISVESISFVQQEPCLFGFVKDFCSYNSYEPTVFLGLGGALAAVGLILAVYQLSNPKWFITLSIKPFWQRNMVFVLSFLGLFFSLIAATVTQLPHGYLPIFFTQPISYELIAFLLFIAAPVSLFVYANKSKGIFNEQNSRVFYETLVSEVSKGDEIRINAVLEILIENVEEIFSVLVTSQSEVAKGNANAVVDVLLSDSSIVSILSTKRLDALLYLLSTAKKYNLNRRHSHYGFQRLFEELILNHDSYLYKQLEREGLALSSNVYEELFGEPVLLDNFDFFSNLRYSTRSLFEYKTVKVLIEAMEKTMDTYFTVSGMRATSVNSGLEVLSNVMGDMVSLISKKKTTEEHNRFGLSDQESILSDIAYFFTISYSMAGKRYGQGTPNEDVLRHEANAREANIHSYSYVNEAIAEVSYRAFEQLSRLDANDTYHETLKFYEAMGGEESRKTGYRNPFTNRIWAQIAKNVKQRLYPNVTKSYLVFGGFLVASDTERTGWYAEQAERIRRLLYIDLKPLLEAGESMVDKRKMEEELLPDFMSFKDGKFFYRFGFGQGELKEIAAPEKGAKSAIEDVDLTKEPL